MYYLSHSSDNERLKITFASNSKREFEPRLPFTWKLNSTYTVTVTFTANAENVKLKLRISQERKKQKILPRKKKPDG